MLDTFIVGYDENEIIVEVVLTDDKRASGKMQEMLSRYSEVKRMTKDELQVAEIKSYEKRTGRKYQ